MSRNIPFQIERVCIDCGEWHGRDPRSWRCWECDEKVKEFNQKASYTIKQLIKAGQMQKPSDLLCVDCEKPAYDYDHRDYRMPLEVQPVCRKCNQRRGPAAWKNYNEPTDLAPMHPPVVDESIGRLKQERFLRAYNFALWENTRKTATA